MAGRGARAPGATGELLPTRRLPLGRGRAMASLLDGSLHVLLASPLALLSLSPDLQEQSTMSLAHHLPFASTAAPQLVALPGAALLLLHFSSIFFLR